jgi:hypothetical protein
MVVAMQEMIKRAIEHKTKDSYWIAGRNNLGYLGKIWACEIVTLKHPLEERTFYNGKDFITIPINNDEELLKLYHYETLIAIINMTTGKILYARNERWSLSDRNGLNTVAYYLKKLRGVEIEDYEFVHGYIYYGEKLKEWKERNAKIRESLINKFDGYKDAIPILESLGFEVILVDEKHWEELFNKNNLYDRYRVYNTWVVFIRPNKIAIRYSEKGRLVVTEMYKKLNDVVILKTVYYDKFEHNDFKKVYVYDVRLIGIDETHQYWSLRLPVNYYLAKIETCERWVMGINEQHEVVQEQ